MSSPSQQYQSPVVSPENRLNVIPFVQEHFEQELTSALNGAQLDDVLEIEHDIDSRTGAKYVLYNVPKPVGNVLHKRFYFQDTNEFDMDWFRLSIQYTKSLGKFDMFTLKSYTKYGDEIVNNYLRDPAGFRTNRRVNDLLFNIMPTHHHLCFAIQFLRHRFKDKDEDWVDSVISNFLTGNGELISSEVQDLLEIWDDYRDDFDTIIPMVEEYIKDLNRIIAAAPKPNRPMRVFRGTERDYLRNSVGISEHCRGFTSTSMNPDTTFRFKARKNAFEIIIDQNVSCVVTEDLTYFPHEYEILIGSNTIVKAGAKHRKYELNMDEGYGDYDVDAIFDPDGNDVPRVYSRLVAVQDDTAAMAGGKSPYKNLKIKPSKFTRSARLKKMLKTKLKTRKSTDRREYRRPNMDPVLVKGPPIPKEVDAHLDSLLKQFR